MSRLRNRIRKADYWTDGELLRWPRDKRATYSGLWAMAEDSGCLEYDCFGWKWQLWPSPSDDDITVELLEQWRDELVEDGKLIVYEVEGKKYLFLRSFHKHEHPRNPASPNLPLPPWVTWTPGSREAKERAHYEVDWNNIGVVVQRPTVKKTKKTKTKAVAVVDDDGFDAFWKAYPNKVGRRAAMLKWKHLTKAERKQATEVAKQMSLGVAAGVQEAKFCPHPTTFINQKRWEDWNDGPPPAWQNGGKRGGLTAEQIMAQAQALRERGE